MDETADAWRRYPTATVSDCLDRLHAVDAGLRRVAGEGVAGRAFTVQTAAGDSATLHLALMHAPPESVLVIDAGGHTRRAVWGGILTEAAQQRGIRGLVLDGVVRDLADIRNSGFAVFARGTCPAGPQKGFEGRWGEPVACGGVTVNTGDLILGDEDGIVVVPSDRIEHLSDAVAQRRNWEEELRVQLRRGAHSASLLGLLEPPGQLNRIHET